MLDNKRILFVGPLGNPDNNLMDKFDIIIRTNNFFSIDKRVLKSSRCDILIVNKLYSTKYSDIINNNIDKLKYVLAKNKAAYDVLIAMINPSDRHKVLYMSYTHSKHTYKINKQPLIVSNLLLYITEYFTPSLLYLTGFDFYTSIDVNKFWLPGYATKESLYFNILKGDKDKHDVLSNIKYLKFCLDKYKWITCDTKIYELVKKLG
jgi:hypothetical protein